MQMRRLWIQRRPLQDVALRDWRWPIVKFLLFTAEKGEQLPAPKCCCCHWNDSSSFSSAVTGTHASSFVKLRPWPWTTVTDSVPVAVTEDLEEAAEWLHSRPGRTTSIADLSVGACFVPAASNKWSGLLAARVASWAVSEVGRKRIVAERLISSIESARFRRVED